jgi:hypothetical protein
MAPGFEYVGETFDIFSTDSLNVQGSIGLSIEYGGLSSIDFRNLHGCRADGRYCPLVLPETLD